MRTPRAAALVMAAGLIASACGARLPASVHQQAQNAILNPATGTTGTNGSTGDNGSTGGLPGGTDTSAPGTGSQPGTTSTTTSQTGGSKGSQTGGATTAPTSGSQSATCGTGTDVGLTSSSIDLGTIADVTGPVSGLFQGAEEGAQTFAAYANANGGICGHHVTIDFRDGGTNCTQTENATQDLASKVFAFVGTFALYDNCAATILKQHPTIPDIHDSLDPAAGALPNHFDIESGQLGYANGMFAYYRQKFGSKVQHVGTISEELSSADDKQRAITHAAETEGWKFVYQVAEQPTNANFVSDFQKMCGQDHIQIFFTVTEDAQNAATMIQNENEAGCPKSLINVIPIAYDQAFAASFKSDPSAINSVIGYNEFANFFNKEDAAAIPQVALFQQWFERTYPGQPINLYAMYAWASGLMLEQGMENAGSTLSRTTVLAALHKIKNFTADGMIAPENPSSKTVGVHCYVLWKYVNGTPERYDDPSISGSSGGYRCDGRFVAA